MTVTAYEGKCEVCDRTVFRWIRSTNSQGYYVRCQECGEPRWATAKQDAPEGPGWGESA